MFNLNQYLSDLTVAQDDEELKRALDIIELDEIMYNDPWLSRQGHFGVAGAMERQLDYLGGTLLPNSEAKLQRMNSNGVIGESYTQDSWFGTTNEDDPHVNEEVSFDQQVDDQQEFVNSLENRMRTAGIVFVTRIRAHDELSKQLDQLSYSAIKAKAESNRQARNVKVA